MFLANYFVFVISYGHVFTVIFFVMKLTNKILTVFYTQQ